VADTNTTWRTRASHSPKFRGRFVEGRREAEPVVDEHLLAGLVAVEHAADLRHGLVALVDDDQGVRGQVVEERRRGLARGAAREVARVVLDPVAITDLAHHLEIEHGPLVQALRLEQPPVGFKDRQRWSSSALIASAACVVRSLVVTKCVFG